jgi:hypothetical protein
MNHELPVLAGAFVAAAVLQLLARSKWISIVLPAVLVFFTLGYFEAHRPYEGGGASFYIFVQCFAAIFAAFLSAVAVAIVERLWPRQD